MTLEDAVQLSPRLLPLLRGTKMTNHYCELSNREGTGRCGARATKQVRVACPNGRGIWCCDEHYEMVANILHLEGVIEF